MRTAGVFAAGLVTGILVMALAVWQLMPGMMLTVHESRYGFDKTVEEITKAVGETQWVMPKVYDLDNSLKQAGHEDIGNMAILEICQPHHAYNILKNDEDKRVTAIMPCRIGVYETRDGRTWISGMNIGLMSRMFGGNIATVMGGVASEEHEMFKSIFK